MVGKRKHVGDRLIDTDLWWQQANFGACIQLVPTLKRGTRFMLNLGRNRNGDGLWSEPTLGGS
jgi:hypothetical protein